MTYGCVLFYFTHLLILMNYRWSGLYIFHCFLSPTHAHDSRCFSYLTLLTPCGVNLTQEDHFHALQKTISITVLRFYDFVRLSIVISFHIMFSDSTHKWHPYNQICAGVWSEPVTLIAMEPLKKKFLQLQNKCKNCLPCPWNHDTKIDFLSQILRRFWGTEYLANVAQTAILFLLVWQKRCSRALEWYISDSCSYDMSSKWCQIWYVK